MSLEQLNTIEDVNRFLDGTQAVAFGEATSTSARYRWAQKTLVKHGYMLLSKADKGIMGYRKYKPPFCPSSETSYLSSFPHNQQTNLVQLGV
ncbi:MAG: hypothetical protein H8E58_10990 [SAR92 clade bacterium]|nr:hypothetical protein [SAR92 clade bacterium]